MSSMYHPPLHRPIAVFDAGIGSYAWAKAIREAYPQQDIIYFADRANFPYALKTKEKLSDIIQHSIERLAHMGASLVIVTSNAPSVVVLDEVKSRCTVPVLGSFPPIEAGLKATHTCEIANLGVELLLASPEFRFYIQRLSLEKAKIHLLNASELVHFVEDGSFINNPEETQARVNAYMAQLRQAHPNVDVCTLSSTHLCWIIDYFKQAAPDIQFINPVEQTVKALVPYVTQGTGQMRCYATASKEYPLIGLQLMFEKLNIPIQLEEVPV